MATAQLYHYVAPKEEMTVIAKPLIRLLRSHRLVIQCVILFNQFNCVSCVEKYKVSFSATLPPSLLREM